MLPTVTVKVPESGPAGIWLIEIVPVPALPDFSAPEMLIDPLLPVAGLSSADVASSVSDRARPRLSYVRVKIMEGAWVEEFTPYCAFMSPTAPKAAGRVGFPGKTTDGSFCF